MKNIYKAVSLALAIASASTANIAFAETKDEVVNVEITAEESNVDALVAQNGWVYDGDSWKFYENNAYKTGWLKYGGNWYYLSLDDGVMVHYPALIDGTTYVFRPDGSMVSNGWYKHSNKWYYLTSSGAAKTGWNKINGKWYSFNNDGIMRTGVFTDIDGKVYLLSSNGDMVDKTGWYKFNGSWYYLTSSGAAKTGWLLDSGKWYYLGQDGKMFVGGPYTIDGVEYFFDCTGAMH